MSKSIFKGVKNKIWVQCQADLPTDKIKDNIEHFSVLISKLKDSEYKALLERVKDDRTTIEHEISKIMHDWKVKGPDDENVDFNPENVEQFFEEGPYKVGLVEAFYELHIGKKTYKRLLEKN